MSIPFRQPIQLITLDHRFSLLPRSVLEQSGSSISAFQFTAQPSQPIFVGSNLKVQGVLGHGREQIIEYVQIIRVSHIDEEKNSAPLYYPDSLYDKLLLVKTRENLVDFVKNWDFSIIPRQDDFHALSNLYQEAGIASLPERYLFVNIQPENPDDVPKAPKDQWEAIEKIYLNFLWKKIIEFQKFATMWETGNLKEHATAWINRELELVSPIFTTYQGYALKNVRTTRSKPNETLEEIVGMRKTGELEPLVGYRAYGHFALCCLEFLFDMQNGLQIFSCETCGALRKRARGNKRKACSKKESKKCFLTRQAERQRRRRIKVKTA